jgi:gliding motility-associated-like protein
MTNDVLTTDMTVNSAQEVTHYQIMATDECDTETNSSTMSSILLEVASSSPDQNSLLWTNLLAPSRQLVEYQLCRVILDNETLIYQTVSGPRNFDDFLTNPNGSTICYLVKAVHTNTAGSDTLIAQSNTVCIEPKSGVYIPNAFVPDGLNFLFKPEEAITGSISNYRMQIFNRWGGEVFETNALADGWNGQQDGNPLDPGVYFYIIKFEQPDGTFEQRSGTVNLIR